MRQVSAGFKLKLQSGLSSLVRLWKIEVSCKATLYFTDSTRDIFYNNIIWKSRPGVQISAVRKSVQDGFDDAEVKFPVTDEGISEDVVRYNELNGAAFTIIAVHFDALNLGDMHLFSGRLRDARIEGQLATIKALGTIKDASDLVIGEVYSERCRNVIYDKRCKVDPKKYRVPFRVTGVRPDGNFYISLELPENPTETENNEVITSLEEKKYAPTIESGQQDFSYTVPANATSIEVEIVGGGGGLSMFYVREGKTQETILGTNGSATTFLDMTAPGGGHGGFNVAPGVDISKLSDPSIFLLLEPSSVGTGVNGISNGTNVNNHFYLSVNFTGRLLWPHHGRVSGGGGAGQAFKIYKVGPNEAIKPGDVINFKVGTGGRLERAAELSPLYAGPHKGDNGSVRITAKKSEITTIVKANTNTDWDYGSIEWDAGVNACRISVIRDVTSNVVSLLGNTVRPVQIGDTGYYRPGCTNYRSYCKSKFNNLPNFRGEPDVPNITGEVTPGTNPETPPIAQQNGAISPFPF